MTRLSTETRPVRDRVDRSGVEEHTGETPTLEKVTEETVVPVAGDFLIPLASMDPAPIFEVYARIWELDSGAPGVIILAHLVKESLLPDGYVAALVAARWRIAT